MFRPTEHQVMKQINIADNLFLALHGDIELTWADGILLDLCRKHSTHPMRIALVLGLSLEDTKALIRALDYRLAYNALTGKVWVGTARKIKDNAYPGFYWRGKTYRRV